jgi:hypothetical protein
MFLYCRWLVWWRCWWRGFWRGWRVNLIWKLYTNLTHPKLYTNLTQMKCKVSPVVRTVLGCCVMCKVLASTTGRYSDSEFYYLYPFHPEQISVKEAFSQPEFWRVGLTTSTRHFDRQTDVSTPTRRRIPLLCVLLWGMLSNCRTVPLPQGVRTNFEPKYRCAIATCSGWKIILSSFYILKQVSTWPRLQYENTVYNGQM